jgi:hypothetical protein
LKNTSFEIIDLCHALCFAMGVALSVTIPTVFLS